MEMEAVESGATLIITPSTILHQWVEEIQKHIHNTNIRLLIQTIFTLNFENKTTPKLFQTF
jgi:SNF2 family DNA or RNA helicase